MKNIFIFILLGALVLPASASTIGSWTQTDISGHNLTLNYTSSFNVTKNDTLSIIINNIGNESVNDSITINKINVSETSKANGSWTGSLFLMPNSSRTIDMVLNISTKDRESIHINVYYNISSENKSLVLEAYFGGAPVIATWYNNKTNNNSTSLTVNTSEMVRFNVTSDQFINDWKWERNNSVQSNNYNNFSTSWNEAGIKTLKVNAINDNGSSQSMNWTITVLSISGSPAPIITSWGNNRTNNNSTTLTINESQSINFNFTANQTLTSWLWTLNGNSLSNPFDNLTRTFNNEGFYRIGARGSNSNGSTQLIVWNVTVLDTDVNKKKNATLLSWYPQVVDYIEVNGTMNETIEYSISTVENMTTYSWSVDGIPVAGYDDGYNTYFYTHTWNNSTIGAHTVIFKGNDSDTKIEFRWYVNVYREGTYSGGNLFDIIDEALENHVTDLKIRMFKYKLSKGNGKSEYAIRKVNQLHDEIAKRQMTREALRKEFKAGNITIDEYVAALKQVQLDAKYNSRLAKGYAKIAKEEKDDDSEDEFKKISEIEKKEYKDEKKEDRKEYKEEKKEDRKEYKDEKKEDRKEYKEEKKEDRKEYKEEKKEDRKEYKEEKKEDRKEYKDEKKEDRENKGKGKD